MGSAIDVPMGLHAGRVLHATEPLWLGAALAVAAGFALAPYVVGLLTPTRRPGRALRERLESTPGTPAARQVRVVPGEEGERIDAFAVGVVPTHEYVFVTEALIETFEPDEAAAVLAHEAGHLGRGHLRRRCAAAVCAGPAWGALAAAVPGVGAGAALVGFAGTVLAVAVVLGVHHEYDADRHAARRVGRDPTLRALERLERSANASRAPAPLDRLSARAWLRRRIARLRVDG